MKLSNNYAVGLLCPEPSLHNKPYTPYVTNKFIMGTI